jgi:hypothetical protein
MHERQSRVDAAVAEYRRAVAVQSRHSGSVFAERADAHWVACALKALRREVILAEAGGG